MPTSKSSHKGLILFLVVLVIYLVFAAWAVRRHTRSELVTFDKLTEFHIEDRLDNLRQLATHGYVRWTGDKENTAIAGVVLHDQHAAWPGYNLFTDDRQHVLLMDMTGEIVHSWHVRGVEHLEFAHLFPNGDILAVCVDAKLVKLDRLSREIWEYVAPVHHDVEVDSNGTVIVPVFEYREYKGQVVRFDALDFLSPEGEFMDRWSSYDNVKALQKLHGPAPLDKGVEGEEYEDYYHLNSVQVLPDTALGRRDKRFRKGNYLICLRNVNSVVILDSETREAVWHWGEDLLELPHMPRMLPNGNILVFDNGTNHGRSRVVEVDPATRQIVWQYQADSPSDFFSAFRGSNQRLPNGNTLICSGEQGRVFEVTPAGKIVWEFWSPIFNEQGQRRRIYRFSRLPVESSGFLGDWDWELVKLLAKLILLGAFLAYGMSPLVRSTTGRKT